MAYMTAPRPDQRGTAVPGRRAWAAYDGGTESIAAARALVAGLLREAQAQDGVEIAAQALDDAQLVVSELVTNACKYAPGPIAVAAEIAAGALEITVWDGDPVLPMAETAGPGRIGQHGLEIVVALCEGLDMRREPAGKRVRVTLLLDPAARR